ncbi:MAG: restriction endonuclease subunit S [Candidatus Kuenenia stuttgartiensis]|nr:restriction endonuclease subunit S [Candidatus Kuenenia stuttgartiensis]
MTATKATFPKYRAYKDSGEYWLGEIPEHWEVGKLGTLLKPVSIKNRPDLPLLSITREAGVIERNLEDDTENHNFIPDDLSGYKILKEGQFGMNKMKAWQGSYGIATMTGIVSPAYYVFDFNSSINPRFFHLAVRSKNYVAFFGQASDGVRVGQWDLSKTRMKEIPFFIPPLPEQTAIAKFLDDKTAKIDLAITQKEKMIALLKERKQIIIQNAVTKGLDPNAKMKDSGVEWIGEIPEKWELLSNKNIFKLIKNQVGKNSSKYDLLSLTLRGIIKRDMENPEGKFPAEFDTYQEVKKGDFVFCLFDVEETPRTVGLSEYDGMITGAYTVLRTFKKVNNIFLYYFYLNLDSRKELKYLYKGLRNTIPKDSFFSFKSLIPPLNEQTAIVAHIEAQSAKVDKAIALQEQQIEKLKELKSTLIDSAVMGKIKVS